MTDIVSEPPPTEPPPTEPPPTEPPPPDEIGKDTFYVREDDENNDLYSNPRVKFGNFTFTRTTRVQTISQWSDENRFPPSPMDNKEYKDIALIEMKGEDRYRMAQESGDPIGFYNKYIKAKKNIYLNSKTNTQYPKDIVVVVRNDVFTRCNMMGEEEKSDSEEDSYIDISPSKIIDIQKKIEAEEHHITRSLLTFQIKL